MISHSRVVLWATTEKYFSPPNSHAFLIWQSFLSCLEIKDRYCKLCHLALTAFFLEGSVLLVKTGMDQTYFQCPKVLIKEVWETSRISKEKLAWELGWKGCVLQVIGYCNTGIKDYTYPVVLIKRWEIQLHPLIWRILCNHLYGQKRTLYRTQYIIQF